MADRQTQTELESSFRESLGEVAAILEKIAPFCQTTEDAIGLIKLGTSNDAQLRLLMAQMTSKGTR